MHTTTNRCVTFHAPPRPANPLFAPRPCTLPPESQGIELSGRIQILDSGDLLISNVRESDTGLYTCIRANEAGVVTGEAHLGVMGKWSPSRYVTNTRYEWFESLLTPFGIF